MRETACTVGASVALILVSASAFAQVADRSETPTYTGCLSAEDGTVYGFAEGAVPAVGCAQGDGQISLSAGDVTEVLAGDGLLGGASSGVAKSDIAPSFQLPQECDEGQVTKWNPDTDSWTCGVDLDTTYGAGAGLRLDEANNFHLDQGAIAGPAQAHQVWVSPQWLSHERTPKGGPFQCSRRAAGRLDPEPQLRRDDGGRGRGDRVVAPERRSGDQPVRPDHTGGDERVRSPGSGTRRGFQRWLGPGDRRQAGARRRPTGDPRPPLPDALLPSRLQQAREPGVDLRPPRRCAGGRCAGELTRRKRTEEPDRSEGATAHPGDEHAP